METIREGLGAVGYGQITSMTVFRTILAVAGEEDVHARRWEALAREVGGKLAAAVGSTEQALQRAVGFLRERVQVPFARLVPYQPQIMLLAVFFHHCPEPTDAQVRDLERWFWGTSWSGHFAGANSTDIKNALRDMADFANGRARLPWEPQSARPFPERFDLRSARVRAYILWELRTFRKRLTPGGEAIDPVEVFATSETEAYRHVVLRSVASISHPANRLILPTAPGVSVRGAMVDLPHEDRAQILASHGVPPIAFDRLQRGDNEGFITERARSLIVGEQGFMAEMGIEPAASPSGEAEIDTE